MDQKIADLKKEASRLTIKMKGDSILDLADEMETLFQWQHSLP